MYQNLGIDCQTKSIIYSDGLDVEKCLQLKSQCDVLGIQGDLNYSIPVY